MSSALEISSYPVNDAVFLVDGIKLALVQSAKEKIISNDKPIVAFGDSDASDYYTEKSYEIELVRHMTEGEADFSWRSNFTLTVEKESGSIEYGGCRCKKIETVRRGNEPVSESLTISALSRRTV